MLRCFQAWVALRPQRFFHRTLVEAMGCQEAMEPPESLLGSEYCCLSVPLCLGFSSFLLVSGLLAACFAGLLAGGLAASLACSLARWLLPLLARLLSRLLVAGLAACMCRSVWFLWLLAGCLASWLADMLLCFAFSA